MSYSINELKKDVNEVLAICQEDLQAIKNGKKRQATKEQIEETIIPEMKNLLEMIEKNNIPPKEKRWVLSGAYITRGWNWDIWSNDKLNMKLPELDNKYRYELE